MVKQERTSSEEDGFAKSIQIFAQTVATFRTEMEKIDQNSKVISRRTSRIIRGVLAILVLAFAYIFSRWCS
ncbi:hypothetical protein [Candidatus Magnetaquicoccus inordinatus]|uniref:hypothetical protein n=1 Tax=Candidatus Magnetaquicoccus inordinatus TaxID=2496818 RepID=UPI00102B1FDA|nr:hypothetical protein [Candidatus Magnetaquicoccus inordinatus]